MKVIQGEWIIAKQSGKEITSEQADRLHDDLVDLLDDRGFVLLKSLFLQEIE